MKEHNYHCMPMEYLNNLGQFNKVINNTKSRTLELKITLENFFIFSFLFWKFLPLKTAKPHSANSYKKICKPYEENY